MLAVLVVSPLCAAQAAGPKTRTETCPETRRIRVAWEFMAARNYMAAMRHFQREGLKDTTCGGPKIGYALAVSAMGDLRRGAKSMRQALWLDPSSVRQFRVDSRVRTLLQTLVDRCLLRLGADDTDKDTALLLAALYYINRDEAGTRYALEVVRGNDDAAASAVNFEQLAIERFGPVPMAAVVEEDAVPVTEPAVAVTGGQDAPPPAALDDVQTVAVAAVTIVPPEQQMTVAPAPLDGAMDPWAPAAALPVAPGTRETETAPVQEPARAPEPELPPEPVEPVDYDKLREDMQNVSDSLNSFAQKLIERIQKAKETLGQE